MYVGSVRAVMKEEGVHVASDPFALGAHAKSRRETGALRVGFALQRRQPSDGPLPSQGTATDLPGLAGEGKMAASWEEAQANPNLQQQRWTGPPGIPSKWKITW